MDKLLNKALQAPSVGGGCVIPITVPYYEDGLKYIISIYDALSESRILVLKAESVQKIAENRPLIVVRVFF